MFKYLIIFSFVGMLAFAGFNFWRVSRDTQKIERLPVVAKSTPTPTPEKLNDFEFPFVTTSPNIPVPTATDATFKKDHLVSDGLVKDVRDGVAKVETVKGVHYVRTSASVASSSTVSAVGKIFSIEPRLVEKVMLSDGRVVKVGAALVEGVVESITEASAVLRRGDSGLHYLTFSDLPNVPQKGSAVSQIINPPGLDIPSSPAR